MLNRKRKRQKIDCEKQSIENLLDVPPRNKCAYMHPISGEECIEIGVYVDQIQPQNGIFCSKHIKVSDILLNDVKAKINEPFFQQMYNSLKKIQDLDCEIAKGTDSKTMKELAKNRYYEASNWFIGTHPLTFELFYNQNDCSSSD